MDPTPNGALFAPGMFIKQIDDLTHYQKIVIEDITNKNDKITSVS